MTNDHNCISEKGLISFGYWRSLYTPLMPDAAWFVDPAWEAVERQRVIQYLRQGRPIAYWMGHDQCQFHCQIPSSSRPYVELTDGTYIWPELLAHYLEHHQVRLPQLLVSFILEQPNFPEVAAAAISEYTQSDFTWWQTQTGWNAHATTLLLTPLPEVSAYVRRYERGQLFLDEKTPQERQAIEQMIPMLRQLLN